MNIDNEGFWYPKVNDLCVNCGLCAAKCPSLNDRQEKGQKPTVYAAWSKNDDTRITSTSGGVFWEIANQFIAVGGVVVGDGGQQARLADAAFLQHAGAAAVAGEGLTVVVVVETLEGLLAHVDGGDVPTRAR